MKIAAYGLAAALFAATPALAQPMPPPGLPNDQAVDPAPGATRPYLGHPNTFYDPVRRLQDIDTRAAAMPSRQRAQVGAEIRRVHAFADTQRARHGGELRDWDRERMTQMIDELVSSHPELGG